MSKDKVQLEVEFYSKFLADDRRLSITDLSTLFLEQSLTVADPNFGERLTQTTPMVTPSATESAGIIYSSAYETNSGYTGTHTATLWEFATDSSFTNIVHSNNSTVNLTEYQGTGLAPLTLHFVRIAHISGNFISSSSPIISFTTGDVVVTTPSVDVTSAPFDVIENPVVSGGIFSIIGSSETHVTTDWEIYSGATLIWSSLADPVNLESITIPRGFLVVSTEYTFNIRYNTTSYNSAYGSNTFTTTAVFPYGIYLATTGRGGTDVYGQDVDTFTNIFTDVSKAKSVAWDNTGTYLATTTEYAPYFAFYKRDFDNFTRLADPAVIPTVAANVNKNCSFSPNGKILIVLTNAEVIVYDRTGDTLTEQVISSGMPAGAQAVSFNRAGTKVAVYQSEDVFIFNIDGTDLLTYSHTITSAGFCYSICFGLADRLYVKKPETLHTYDVGISASTLVHTYSSAGLDTVGEMAVNIEGTRLYMVGPSLPYLEVANISADAAVEIITGAFDVEPGQAGYGVSVNGETGHVAVVSQLAPVLTIYAPSTGANELVKLADVTQMPAGITFGCEFFPRIGDV
jgi:hypothetical protein